MEIASGDLARVLNQAGFVSAGSAADNVSANVHLASVPAEQVRRTYAIRLEAQRDAGRSRVARELRSLLEALDGDEVVRVPGCRVQDAERVYDAWLDEDATRVLAVAVPPRRPSGETVDACRTFLTE